MWKENLPKIIKLAAIVLIMGLLSSSMFYLNSRWGLIRDIRRLADAQQIVKGIQYYYNQFEELPESQSADNSGWDKSNNLIKRVFLEPLLTAGILQRHPFDPKNDNEYYYRYKKFPAGTYGCARAFSVFQVMKYETNGLAPGWGVCQTVDFTKLAPSGYTWQEFE
jgi:hypothetical protein